MKPVLFLLLSVIIANNLSAQDTCKPCSRIEFSLFKEIKDSVCTQIKRQTDSLNARHARDTNKFKLVTDFTFRRTFSKEFAEILIQENTFSNLNRHASLKIDEDESKVSFIPFVFRNGKLGYDPLKFYGSFEFSAEINDQQIFKLFDKEGLNRSFQLNVNLNFIPNFQNKGFFVASPPQYNQFAYWRECARQKICADYDEILNPTDTCENVTALLDEVESLCDTTDFRRKIWDKFADAEEKLAKGYWTQNLKSWFTLVITPYGHTENNGLDTTTKQLKELNYYSPAGRIVFNQLRNFLCTERSLYWNVWAEIKRKSSFTGVDPVKWNHILRLSDTTFSTSETKDAYNYDPANYTLKYLPSFGGQFIYIHSFPILKVGIDITYKYDRLPRPVAGEEDYAKSTITAGILFPFNNKDGKRTINFEPYYSYSFFSRSELESESFIGLKFSIPIFSKNE